MARQGAGGGASLSGTLRGSRPWPVAFFDFVRAAWHAELAERRLFLWLPVAAGVGVLLYMSADHEPSLAAAVVWTLAFGALAWLFRARPIVFPILLSLTAVFAGFTAAAWRVERVAAPVLNRILIGTVSGTIEEMDIRQIGARFIIRVDSIEGLAPEQTPYRVRLTTKTPPNVEAGTYVQVKARLVPPAHADLPGGYDFARDAYFMRLGAVGNALGQIEVRAAPQEPSYGLQLAAAIDRFRNLLAARANAAAGGEAGPIAAAMVTGKRDLLPEETKDIIREAGIFHIVTISGLQITLVAGLLFLIARRCLALSSHLALHYPIRKWAAAFAMIGALAYDMLTGSRIGTERALIMTLIVMGAILCDRRALTMRNLALAMIVVIALEPEALLGASFQLSFAAVAALIAVLEAKMRSDEKHRQNEIDMPLRRAPQDHRGLQGWFARHVAGAPKHLLAGTAAATCATAAFMAYDFHELSPYVLIGNPLTLLVIEFFAVPGALLGALLYPLGLDGPVWTYVGMGINIVMAAAGHLSELPGATLHLKAFAPSALLCFTLALACAVIWRSTLFRLAALPLIGLGMFVAAQSEAYDIFIPSYPQSIAVRQDDGTLGALGLRPDLFALAQWLSADGDSRTPRDAALSAQSHCDKLACIATLPNGEVLSLVLQAQAFYEDCTRANIIVSPLIAPDYCKAQHIFDREKLLQTGAVALRWSNGQLMMQAARAPLENRPWSPLPTPIRKPSHFADAAKPSQNSSNASAPKNDYGDPFAYDADQ
ncbi:ComEC/Rec2 family competence protein [Methylovirgula sp. 4M-Z18]|uniref:ComEC/Rec2 family competence protein n=1 Tax=Methylovirgula sp. 4M-Z18 TaxID=2293567 RepID=UPI000E2F4EF0|nr:ComEC/Rec2 family competence protein [Methylovirgula sp. 4M-Z18]RFB80203.1 DUF4131 domain-containing protein [Methylovirgula sp. 4M-Z18]